MTKRHAMRKYIVLGVGSLIIATALLQRPSKERVQISYFDDNHQRWIENVEQTELSKRKNPKQLEQLEEKLFYEANTTNVLVLDTIVPAYINCTSNNLADIFKTCAKGAQKAYILASIIDSSDVDQTNTQKLIEKSTDELATNDTYNTILKGNLQIDKFNCQAYAITSAAIALNLMKNATNPPRSLELIAGIVFEKTAAPHGVGHMWIRVDSSIIDRAMIGGTPSYVPLVGVDVQCKKKKGSGTDVEIIYSPKIHCLTPDLKK